MGLSAHQCAAHEDHKPARHAHHNQCRGSQSSSDTACNLAGICRKYIDDVKGLVCAKMALDGAAQPARWHV